MARFNTVKEIYEYQREYFSRPDAVLAKDFPEDHENASCMYRLEFDPEGPGCAVGCLIPNELYVEHFEEIEGQTVSGIWRELIEVKIIPDDELIKKWLRRTQNLHDQQATSPQHFVELLDDLYIAEWKPLLEADDGSG